MADERQSPDVILAITELTGLVGAIQDDPDSPDGSWLVADNNNVNTAVRISVPTPTGNPTVGADLQEFRVLFRQFDEAQGGTPEGRIELWEDGILIRVGADVGIPDGGLVVSFTWNANELANADGSLVEINVVGTKSGGSPGNRNSVEVGAVEWNVVYDVGAAVVEGTAVGSGVGLATSNAFVEVIGQAQASGIGLLGTSGYLVIPASANGGGVGLANALAYLEITGQAYGEGIGASEALGEIAGGELLIGEAFGSGVGKATCYLREMLTGEALGSGKGRATCVFNRKRILHHKKYGIWKG